MKYCKEEDIKAYMIMINFKKAYDRIDSKTIEETIRAMNFGGKIIDLFLLLYAESETIIVTNEKKSEIFKTKGGVRQGCPLSPYLFIIVTELMEI